MCWHSGDSPRVLHLGVRCSAQERCGSLTVGPEEDQEDDQCDETPFLWGQAEKAEVVQHGEEKAQERPHWPSSTLRGLIKGGRGNFYKDR